ncbi:hypothetical protein [Chamaesiphon sp. VAR_48_metabat_403]|uniref:hypothetical protein n=1 Tax=Chamaesiphon sp. VAR_48_metabat_403 TaxID=2964700 RepID=UPI00286E4919|nr:hypothetical protein [Chamaesiphon sp. VAR_48_metabat_403]
MFSSFAFAQIPHPVSQQIPNIEGTWKMSILGENRSATCTLIQKGNALTGTFRGQMGDLPLTGTVTTDRKMAFSAKFIFGTLKFAGMVKGQTMEGIVDLPMGRGRKNWTATK